jgi:hypothetical protein
MAKKNNFRDAAVKIGSAVGKADGRAHKAVRVAKQELTELSKQVDALKKQLEKSSKKLKGALK